MQSVKRHYWGKLEAIKVQMSEAQKEAEKIRSRLEAAFGLQNGIASVDG
jgi:hypothetical protein